MTEEPEKFAQTDLSVEAIVAGLISDLDNLRAGKISISQARASADLGKQVFAGLRVMIQARKSIENTSIPVVGLPNGETE